MKYNKKQMRASQQRALNYVRKQQRIFLIVLGLLFTIPAFSIVASDNFNPDAGAGVSMAVGVGMMSIGSIEDPPGAEKAGNQVKAKLWLLEESQRDDNMPFPARNGRKRGTIPLQNGEYWNYIKSVEDSPEPTMTGELGDMGPNIKNGLTFIVGGLEQNLLTFLESKIGKGFYVVWEICATGDRYLGGNGCKPMKFIGFDGGAKKDGTGFSLTFENQCGELYTEYIGNTPTVAPAIIAQDATDFVLASGVNIYQLTDGSAASVILGDITGVTDSDMGRRIAIKGSGGGFPTQIDTASGNFLLAGGETWTGDLEPGGNMIEFEVFKDGVDSYKFIEVSRI